MLDVVYSAYPSSNCRAGSVPGQWSSPPRSVPQRAFPRTLRPVIPNPQTVRSALFTNGWLARRGPARKYLQKLLPGVQTTAKPSGVWKPPVEPMTAESARMLSGVTPRNAAS